MSKTRGSEKRARNGWLAARYSAEEEALIRKKAEGAGISVSELIRVATLDYRPPPSKVDTDAINKLMIALGKIGTNINQIAYRYNITEGLPSGNIEGALEAALRDLLEWRTALMQAIGAERNRKPSA
jgi:hypothetical protein